MPAAFRPLILAAVLGCGVIVQLLAAVPAIAAPRWPAGPAVYDVAGWSAGVPGLDRRGGTALISRRYISADGRIGAVLALATSPDAKRVYRAGPEVPFAGAGYAIGAPSDGSRTSGGHHSVFVATRGRDRMIVFATYGERRGLTGNGLRGWLLAILDGVLGRQNDYFEATLVVPIDDHDDVALAQAGAVLADQVFSQIAEWYSR